MKRAASIALNALLIVTCGLTCADIVRSFISRRAASHLINRGPAQGVQFALPGEDWAKERTETLVFGISTHCHFCTESAPFYKRLLTSVGGGIGLVVIAPEPVEQTRLYLGQLGLDINDVRQIPIMQVGIQGTPTLVFVDRRGRVERAWTGSLSPDREQEVIQFASARTRR
jgi:hypothetical protein